MSRRIAGLLLAATALALVIAGVAGASSASTKLQKVPSIAKQVPAKIRGKGTLVVASDATYAPMESIAKDGHTVIGVDPDLAKDLGTVLGLKFKVENASFDGIIPGLHSGKYDIGMSSFTPTKAREKVVDFVTYFSAGVSFYVKSSGGPTITNLGSLCGHSVAVENGTTEQTEAQAQNTKCKKAGKKGVSVKAYPDQNTANLAISSGREQVGMADSEVVAYIVKQSQGQFKIVGKSYAFAPYGIALPKNNGMAKPMLAAVKYLMKQGAYAKVLKKWGVQSGAISNPRINGATS
ncbi:MAG TPA: ABC transporter substrate-binding protein [Gaiellaceae bacterium]|jgi:polar amino acid transport system substrate-binding protein